MVTGDAKRNNNRFVEEIIAIRRTLFLSAIAVLERSCVDLAELTSELSTARPAVLHLAAHAGFGGIAFAVGGRTRWIDQDDVAKAITNAPAPLLTVLNICTSTRLASALNPWCPTVLYWPESIDDDQASHFSNAFYRSLAIGKTIAAAHASSWPGSGLARPNLIGDQNARIF